MNGMSNAARFILFSAAFVVLVAGLKTAEALLVPFLLSVFIALIFSPMLVWLKKRRVPSPLAIAILVFSVGAVGTLMGVWVGGSIREFRADLPEYQARLQVASQGLQAWLQGRGIPFDPQVWQQSFDPGAVMQMAGNMLSSFGNVMTNAFLILLTVIFIFAEEVGFREKLVLARGGELSLEALDDFGASVNRYLAIKTLLSLLTGFLVLLALWALGVDYPVMWAMLAFLLNFVPTVGSILAAVPAVLLALIQLGPSYAGFTALAYVVINIVVGNVLEPRWMGKGLNLSPLVVFLSLVFWGWVLGPVGMLLSIPLTILVKIGLELDPATRWISVLLGSGPAVQAAAEVSVSEQEPQI